MDLGPKARHEILGGLVQLYRRDNSKYWQCSATVDGQQYRTSTGANELAQAKDNAEDWYLGLRGKARAGLLIAEKTFEQAAAQFEKEYEIITEGQRSPKWVEGHKIRIRLHLSPFFGKLGLSQITAGKVQEYRVHRMTTPSRSGKPPARSTLHDELMTLRQVLQTGIRHAWLSHMPNLAAPYKTQGKIVHRPWFSPEEYKELYTATRENVAKALPHFKWNAEQVHDFVLFLANTGLRPDEAKNLQHRDVAVVMDRSTGKEILEIEVRGKRGIGFCKSMPGAVQPYKRLLARVKPFNADEKEAMARGETVAQSLPGRTDPVFPGNHIKMFNNVMKRAKLKADRDGQKRTAYSLRHTYICMRLIEGADIYVLAKNCRTSVEMIQKFYAAHIKDLLDASAINVVRRKPKRPPKPTGPPEPDL